MNIKSSKVAATIAAGVVLTGAGVSMAGTVIAPSLPVYTPNNATDVGFTMASMIYAYTAATKSGELSVYTSTGTKVLDAFIDVSNGSANAAITRIATFAVSGTPKNQSYTEAYVASGGDSMTPSNPVLQWGATSAANTGTISIKLNGTLSTGGATAVPTAFVTKFSWTGLTTYDPSNPMGAVTSLATLDFAHSARAAMTVAMDTFVAAPAVPTPTAISAALPAMLGLIGRRPSRELGKKK